LMWELRAPWKNRHVPGWRPCDSTPGDSVCRALLWLSHLSSGVANIR
jgi:hypothetical protein